MYQEERQAVILDRARTHGRVDVGELAVDFDVTPETVRRDLTALERHGFLRRVHGGAIPVERLGFERGLPTPDVAEAAVKRAMLHAARRVVVLADHTKVGSDCFARFGELDEVDTLVSDEGLDIELAADLQAAGPRVVLA